MVVEDYVKSLPMLCKLFSEFAMISALDLNIGKTVFIPLWRHTSHRHVATLIKEACPSWGQILVASCGKYLGFMVGPGASRSSWDKPLKKFATRARIWSSLHLGLPCNALVYNVFVLSVLGFVMQLEPEPPELEGHIKHAMALLAG